MYAHTISHLRKAVSTKIRSLKYAELSTLYLRFILPKVIRGHLGGQNHEKLFSIQIRLQCTVHLAISPRKQADKPIVGRHL